MPLSALDDLLSYAEQKEAERQLFPLWLAHFAIQTYKGEAAISFEELFKSVEQGSAGPQERRSPGDILADFAPIVSADKKRREA